MRLPALLRRSRQVIFFLRFANKFKISPRYGGIRTPGEILRWGSRSVAIFSELVHATELQLYVNTPKPGMSIENPSPLKLRIMYREGMTLSGVGNLGGGDHEANIILSQCGVPIDKRLCEKWPYRKDFDLSRLFLTDLPSGVLGFLSGSTPPL